jgi:hypothetical protein
MDLSKRPPRSPRVTLGGYALLPRMLDKCRASLANTLGEYKYDCPMDRHFFAFTGLTGDQLKEVVSQGKSDFEVLAWIQNNAPNKREAWEISTWSQWQSQRSPSGAETIEWFANLLKKLSPEREDVATWFELLDLDDYVSFGGKA